MNKVIYLHKNQYNTIDILKLVCAIFVITIHINPLTSQSDIANFLLTNVIARMAVPLFFITTGFLFFRKFDLQGIITLDPYRISLIQRYLIRIFALYIIWTMVYLPFRFGAWSENGFTFSTLLLFMRDFLFDGSYYHLWFLPSCALAVFLTFALLTKVRIEQVLLLAFGLFIVGLFGDSYYGVLTQNTPFLSYLYEQYFTVFVTTRNGLFFGFIFVASGAYISQIRKKINRKRIWGFAGLFLVLLTIEALLLRSFHIPRPDSYNLLLMLIPACIFLFISIINIQIGNLQTNFHLYRHMSILVYVSHAMFITITTYVLEFFKQHTLLYNSLSKFVLVLILTLLFSYFICIVAKKPRFTFLKYLY